MRSLEVMLQMSEINFKSGPYAVFRHYRVFEVGETPDQLHPEYLENVSHTGADLDVGQLLQRIGQGSAVGVQWPLKEVRMVVRVVVVCYRSIDHLGGNHL